MTKKDKDPIQEFNQQAEKVKKKIPNNRVKIADPDDREPLSEEERSGKKAKEPEQNEEQPKERPKNQLARIPNKVELAYEEPAKAEEELDTEDPAHVMARQLENGETSIADLSSDDRMLVIAHYVEGEGLTGDQTAERLGVSRRTIVNYLQKLRKFRAKELANRDIWEYGAELESMARVALKQALEDRKPLQFSQVLKNIVDVLQSMGLLHRQPFQSQQQLQALHKIQNEGGSQGLQQLQQQIQGQELNVESVLNELFSAVEQGKVEEKKKDESGNDGTEN